MSDCRFQSACGAYCGLVRCHARLLGGLLALGGLLVVGGCGGTHSKPMPLDEQVAKDSFTAFLEAWKAGEQQAALKNKTPSIVGGDPDWDAGAKLVSYKVLDTAKSDGSNLHPTAELVLQTTQGRQTSKITYVVGTSPVITVFRKD